MDGKQLLVVVPGVPHESVGASTVLFYQYMNSFRELSCKTRNILLLNPETKKEDHLSSYISRMTKSGQFEVIPIETAGSFLDFRHMRFQVNEFLNQRVAEEIKAFRPDVVVCFDLLSCWLTGSITGARKIVWLGDLNFQTNWYHALYRVKERMVKPVKVIPYICLTWYQCWLWKRIYYRVLSEAASIIVSSKASEAVLSELGLHAKYLPYPWPEGAEDAGGNGTERSQKPTFLFYGSLKGLGSRSAFHLMLHELYPRLMDLWGKEGFEIMVAGRGGLYAWVEEEMGRKPEFRYEGFVEDIEGLMHSCHAVLVPIDVPVGNRSRIITAMANKTLVIAHVNTALSNPELVDGKTCLLANDVTEFISKMEKAVNGGGMLEIVNRARRVYEECFHPEAACGMFVNEVYRVMSPEPAKRG
jgi:glycosyltransferase involved in cell wall biosynthesis